MKESVKLAVRTRAKHCCEYCLSQANYATDNFSIEHIIPLIKGDTNDLKNLAYAFQACNNYKFTAIEAIDPASGNIAILYNPRIDIWAEHFRWSDDCSKIIGITPKGRATVFRIKLNRENLINLRSILNLLGLHPPF